MSEGFQAEMTLQESCLEATRHMSVEVRALVDKTKELESENAKLRELVAEMYEAVKCCCGECFFGYERDPAKCKNENCGYRKEYVAMRELGIEVY